MAELTEEAKGAIRRYLVQIFVPSSAILALIAGVLAYTIRDWGEKSAESNIATTLYSTALKSSQELLASTHNAEGTLQEVRKTLVDVNRIKTENASLSQDVRQNLDSASDLLSQIRASLTDVNTSKELNGKLIQQVKSDMEAIHEKVQQLNVIDVYQKALESGEKITEAAKSAANEYVEEQMKSGSLLALLMNNVGIPVLASGGQDGGQATFEEDKYLPRPAILLVSATGEATYARKDNGPAGAMTTITVNDRLCGRDRSFEGSTHDHFLCKRKLPC